MMRQRKRRVEQRTHTHVSLHIYLQLLLLYSLFVPSESGGRKEKIDRSDESNLGAVSFSSYVNCFFPPLSRSFLTLTTAGGSWEILRTLFFSPSQRMHRPESRRLCDEKQRVDNYFLHRMRLASARPTVPIVPPPEYPHVMSNAKAVQIREDRCIEVDRDNTTLRLRMNSIKRRRPAIPRPPAPAVTSNSIRQRHVLESIAHENQALLKRINEGRATYSRKQWESQRMKNVEIRNRISRYSGTRYPPAPPRGCPPRPAFDLRCSATVPQRPSTK